jgi:hypothetical protein
MGTQQLLLIVLGVIIVGIAVVVGINIFGSNAEQANKDAITQDCLRITAAAQGYYRKPAMLGGGDNSFTDIQITDCGMSEGASTTSGENVNATYVITGALDAFSVIGTSLSEDGKAVTVACNMALAEDLRISVDYAAW